MFKNAACASFARATLAAVLGGAAILVLSSAAYAAEEKKDAEDEDLELTEVQVTGTRILDPNATATQPVTTVTREEMERLGIVNVADALTMLVPQNISTYMPSLVGDNTGYDGTNDYQASGGGAERIDRGAFFIGNTIANLRGMDPTFGSRTLTLVDGRRVVSTSNMADVVDLNIIPSNLLERMDVVTGGASATYGSGAMAGVVNLVLNRRLTGIRLDMDYGVSERGDGGNPHISLSGGLPVFGGRGHVLLGLEWRTQHAIRDCAAARAWCAEARTTFNNGTGTTVTDPINPLEGFDGMPRRFQMANTRYSQWAPTGGVALSSGNTTATTFYRLNAAADPVTGLLGGDVTCGLGPEPADLPCGNVALGYRGGTATTNIMNGDGPLSTTGQTLRPSNETRSLFANFDYDITPTTTASFRATYATTDALNLNRYTTGTYCARFDAPGVRGTAPTPAGTVWVFGTTVGVTRVDTGAAYSVTRTAPFTTSPLSAAGVSFLGLKFRPGELHTDTTEDPNARIVSATSYVTGGYNPFNQINNGAANPGISYPYWIPTQLHPNYPTFDFGGHAVGTWVKVRFNVWDTNPANRLASPGTTNWATGPNTGGTPPNPDGTGGSAGTFSTTTGTLWNNEFWLLDTVTLTEIYDSGTITRNPQMGRNSYAFLQNLAPDALAQVAGGFNNSPSAGSGTGGSSQSALGGLYGNNPCSNYTAIRKVWSPQVQTSTHSETERYTVQAGIRGRFGGDWRWDANLQHGSNDSNSKRNNVATTLRTAFAMDAVVDDRPQILDSNPNSPTYNTLITNPTYGTPICRVTRDGAPRLDTVGRPLSGADALANLAANCQPLNVFGSQYSNSAFFYDLDGNRYRDPDGNLITYDAAAIQKEALAYAFTRSGSSGTTSQQSFSITTSGTLYQGWAGPLRAAISFDYNQNKNSNAGTKGDFYTRADLGGAWSDASSGKTSQAEPSIELSMPLVSGLDGINLLSISGTYRYGLYYQKGGAGTTGEKVTQKTPTWRFSAEFAPFDWARFRMTRTGDMRAATYRDLFNYQPSIPDSNEVRNRWRESTASSNENQNERAGTISVGNPNLKPERSSTLTMGLVLSPGGWAQGMRMSIDYSNIRVKDAINLPFDGRTANTIVESCFLQSGGRDPQFDPETGAVIDVGNRDPETAFDPTVPSCQRLRFAEQVDVNGNPIPGSRNLEDIVSYTTSSPQNGLPYQNRSVDLSWNYNFPLSRAFESLPGSLSFTVRGSRNLEASGVQVTSPQTGGLTTVCTGPSGPVTSFGPCPAGTTQIGGVIAGSPAGSCGDRYERADPNNYAVNEDGSRGAYRVFNRYTCVNLVGQIQSSVFIPGVAAQPKWRGNIQASYLYGSLQTTLSAQYTGGARVDVTWVDDPLDPRYYARDAFGNVLLNAVGQPRLSNATVDNNRVKPYVNMRFNAQYNLKVANMQQFQIYGSIENLMDKSPPFVNGGVGGASGTFGDTFGRAYRLGVRLRF